MIEYPLIQQIGLVLVHFLWQGALIGLLFGLGKALARSGSATTRYNWAVLCLILLALAPLLTFAWLSNSPEAIGQSGLAAMPERMQAGAIAAVQEPAGLTLALAPLLPWVVGLWLAGVMLMSARLGAGWWYVSQLRQRADVRVPASVQKSLNELAARLRMSGTVGLALSNQIAGPMLVGLVKPLILLPTGLINGLSARQVEMVLAHELAHLKRADHLVNLFQNVLETLLFYHPVVRWVSSEIRAERELASDELAASLTGDRVGYAETLLELEKVRADRLPLTIGMADHQLLHRVRYLLAMRSAQSGSVVVGMSLLTVVLVSAMTALVSTGLPSLLERDAKNEEQSVVIEASVEAPSESTLESTIEPVSAAIETEAAVPELDTEVPQPALAEQPPAAPIQAASAETETAAERSRPAASPSDTRAVSTPAIEAPIAETSVMAPIETRPEPAAPILPAAERPPLAVEPASPEAAPIEAVEPLQMASIAAPRPVAQLRGGRPLDRPVPSYPPSAARNRLEGQAEVRLTIGPDGRVVEASLIEEFPAGHGFGEAALEAVRQWRFEPFTRDGRPVRQELQTGFDFTDPPDCGRVTGTRISRC